MEKLIYLHNLEEVLKSENLKQSVVVLRCEVLFNTNGMLRYYLLNADGNFLCSTDKMMKNNDP
ncbi:hypothetical protein T4D_1588 [Trichinella pseudospiralis]|uniref:Uncharacterized protein n=1 Tax=Trichinella pseudospiralis TaxID=6337 RepID=A0A0V1F701_TRIPS|nr:hypothetical protein T4D_1588 [Trichinella pseudospiralis]